MDVSIREWMIIIGALLIVAVLLDGYRRMRNSPKRVRMAIKPVPPGRDDVDDDAAPSMELPNGGARVRFRGADDFEPKRRAEPAGDDAAEPGPLQGMRAGGRGETQDMLVDLMAEEDEPQPPSQRGSTARPEVKSEVLLLHVVASDGSGFAGVDILQVLLGFDLRFGEMNFFHRHERAAGRGPILFSVANMMQPGVFDIDAMAEFNTPGLVFFMTCPGPADMMAAFELMASTARQVAENLSGDLLDDTRSATTRQTLEHMRQRIRDLERRMLTRPG